MTFESVPYFAHIASSLISQLMPSSGDLEKKIVPKLLQMFMIHPKNVISISFRADPESTADDPDPHSVSLPTDLLLRTVEMDTSASSN